MPNFNFTSLPRLDLSDFLVTSPEPTPEPVYPRFNDDCPLGGYFHLETDRYSGFLFPIETRNIAVDFLRDAENRDAPCDWVTFADTLVVIGNFHVFQTRIDSIGELESVEWEVPSYISERIQREHNAGRGIQMYSAADVAPVTVSDPIGYRYDVLDASGNTVTSWYEEATQSVSEAAENLREMAEQLAAASRIIDERPTPAEPGPLEVTNRRRRLLEQIGSHYFPITSIAAILYGPADRRNPHVRRFIEDLASDYNTSCTCLPCQLVRRQITFHQYLDRRWADDYGNRDAIDVFPNGTARVLPAPAQPTIRLENFNFTTDPWSPRASRARRQERRRLNWVPTTEEYNYYFGDSVVNGMYLEPRYRRYDDQGNEVLPGPTTRNNVLPATHPALVERLSPRDAWYSPENARVRNDVADREYDEEDFDEDFPEAGYRSAANYGIQAWDYKPYQFEFFGERHAPTTPFFGFELEINSRFDNAEIVNRVPEMYCKWDGSIEGGFEIVSMPMTWEHLTESFSWDWVPELRNNGAKAGRNGLHIHVSRSSFNNDFHAWRWLKLWSDADNYAPVRAFNRRQNLEYATPFDRQTPYQKARRLGIGDGSRYVLLNANNYETFELRGPASTLNRFKLKGTLAVIAATVEYTRQKMTSTQVALGALEWGAFIQWALENEEYSQYVRKYLEILIEEGAPEAVYPMHLRKDTSV